MAAKGCRKNSVTRESLNHLISNANTIHTIARQSAKNTHKMSGGASEMDAQWKKNFPFNGCAAYTANCEQTINRTTMQRQRPTKTDGKNWLFQPFFLPFPSLYYWAYKRINDARTNSQPKMNYFFIRSTTTIPLIAKQLFTTSTARELNRLHCVLPVGLGLCYATRVLNQFITSNVRARMQLAATDAVMRDTKSFVWHVSWE